MDLKITGRVKKNLIIDGWIDRWMDRWING